MNKRAIITIVLFVVGCGGGGGNNPLVNDRKPPTPTEVALGFEHGTPGRHIRATTMDAAEGSLVVADGEVLIRYKEGTPWSRIERVVLAYGHLIDGHIPAINAIRIRLPEGFDLQEAIGVYGGLDWSTYSAPNGMVELARTSNDPLRYSQWWHQTANIPTAWDTSTGDPHQSIAIIDSGIANTHADLSGKIDSDPGWDLWNDDAEPWEEWGDCGSLFNYGHGSHVAGIATASSNNLQGVAGVSWDTKIVSYRVFGPCWGNGASFWDIATAITMAAKRPDVVVINLSLGGEGADGVIHGAVKFAHEKGKVIVAAAGNSNSSIVNYPAGYPEVIAVASLGQSECRASYSNYGSWIDIAAPGGESSVDNGVLSTYFDGITSNLYAGLQGTSMASPVVAGIVALLKAQHPEWGPETVRQVLKQSADASIFNLGCNAGFESLLGAGLVDAAAAIGSTDITSPQLQDAFPVAPDVVQMVFTEKMDLSTLIPGQAYLRVWGTSGFQIPSLVQVLDKGRDTTVLLTFDSPLPTTETLYAGAGAGVTDLAGNAFTGNGVGFVAPSAPVNWASALESATAQSNCTFSGGTSGLSGIDGDTATVWEGCSWIDNGQEGSTCFISRFSEARYVGQVTVHLGWNEDNMGGIVYLMMDEQDNPSLDECDAGMLGESHVRIGEIPAGQSGWMSFETASPVYAQEVYICWVSSDGMSCASDKRPTVSELEAYTVQVPTMEEGCVACSVPGPTPTISLVQGALDLRLKWKDINWASEYRVYRDDGLGNWNAVATLPAGTLNWTDTTVDPATTYIYALTAVDEGGNETTFGQTASGFVVRGEQASPLWGSRAVVLHQASGKPRLPFQDAYSFRRVKDGGMNSNISSWWQNNIDTSTSGGDLGVELRGAISGGNLALSYLDVGRFYVKTSYNFGGGWVLSTVDTGGAKANGPSVALDNSTIFVGYGREAYYFLESNDYLRVATKYAGQSWITQAPVQVNGPVTTSAQFDSKGLRHLFYSDSSGGLKVLYDCGVWCFETVINEGNGVTRPRATALDDGFLLAYCQVGNSPSVDRIVLVWGGVATTWNTIQLGVGASCRDNDHYDVGLDALGRVHFVVHLQSGSVRHYWNDDLGGSPWSSVDYSFGIGHLPGGNLDLDVGEGGVVHIAFTDGYSGLIHYIKSEVGPN